MPSSSFSLSEDEMLSRSSSQYGVFSAGETEGLFSSGLDSGGRLAVAVASTTSSDAAATAATAATAAAASADTDGLELAIEQDDAAGEDVAKEDEDTTAAAVFGS